MEMKTRMPQNLTFLQKHHRVFSNLSVLLRLEGLLEEYKKKFKEKNITNLHSLLVAIKTPHVKIPLVLTGTSGLHHYQREYLVDLCDPYFRERKDLQKELEFLKRDKKNEENKPLSNPNIRELERQRFLVNNLIKKISDLQFKLDSFGERNTVPPDLYKYSSVEELKELGFIENEKGWPYPKFTERGWTIYSTAINLSNYTYSLLNNGGTASPELSISTWQRMKSLYVQGL